MFSVPVRLALVLSLLSLSSGCALVEPTRTFARQSWHLFRPDPTDYRDTTEESGDQWAFVGAEGRGDRAMERDSDPLRRFLMSEKARNIERNLGVD